MLIDLRSDTVTRPTVAMKRAMLNAKLGDDVLGDDPTVLALQEKVADLLGKEAALFVPSGTMANQLAIRGHCESGDEIICHRDSHIIHYETGGPAALSGVMINSVDGPYGQFTAAAIEPAVRPHNTHNPISKLLIIENTQNRGGGSVWHIAKIDECCQAARHAGLKTHMDGARLWNACIASHRTPAEYAAHFDTISCCFSKGLGAPVGSAVVGSKAMISRLYRFRKMFGGAMRQSGLLAAAAIYALDHHYDRLEQDHDNARQLSMGLANIPGMELAMPVATNMVFVDLNPAMGPAPEFCEKLKAHRVLALPTGPARIRLVTHLDIKKSDISKVIHAFEHVAGRPRSKDLSYEPGTGRARRRAAAAPARSTPSLTSPTR